MKKIFTLIGLILIFLTNTITAQALVEPVGDGSSGNPYQIATLNNLYWVTQADTTWDRNFIQTADIDAAGTSGWDAGKGFSPIGEPLTPQFEGVYDGNGYTISNLFIDRTATNFVGLFSYAANAEIKDLSLSNADVSGDEIVGVLAGRAYNSIITNCSSSGSVSATGSKAGGLIGEVTNSSSVSNSFSSCSVTSSGNTGGFIGYIEGTSGDITISDCYSTGDVTGTNQYVGGFVSSINNSTTLRNCYSTGNVVGNDTHVGGFAGSNNDADIFNSYATGSVTGAYEVGGFLGVTSGISTIDSCSSIGNVVATGSYFNRNQFVGGFVGRNASTITRSCSFGSATGENNIGGFAGINIATINNSFSHGNAIRSSSGTLSDLGGFIGDNGGTIEKCYSIGSVTYTGAANPTDKGFVGDDSNGDYSNNFYDEETSGQTSTGGSGDEYASDLTTAQMKDTSIYISNGYDFSAPIWDINEFVNDGYPFLTFYEFINVTITVTDIVPDSVFVLDNANIGFQSQSGNVDVDFQLMNEVPPNFPGGQPFVGSYWDITNVTGGNVKLRLYYQPSDANEFSGVPTIFHYDGSDWVELATSSEMTDGDWRYVETTNYFSSFSPVTIGDAANPLPVELSSFEGYNTEEGVVLNWETATEVNNFGFEVERENTGSEEWRNMGFVEGNGTTNSPKSYSFTDPNLPDSGNAASYRLKQIDNDGTFAYSKVIEVDLTTITSVENEEIPTVYSLSQNYPNPFNPTTKIKFGLPEAGVVKLSVYNILGQKVAELVNEELQAGYHTVNFGGMDLASGMYIYRINVDSKFSSIKKMLMLK